MAVRSFSQDSKDKATEVKSCTDKSTEVNACAASANEAKGAVAELASSVSQTLQDVASNVSHKAQDWASNVADKAQETATAAVDKTNDGIAAVGHQMNALGGTVRRAAPQDGVIASAATTVADNLQAGGRYLEGHGLGDMGKDLTAVVRHYPIQSMLVGFGIGCLVGMTFLGMTSRRS
ncbi:hypothetical protein AYO44_05875 [Planctomycetaceae bacterium SCGC AG-212-F19]|nr:hypothetical protein AYO44_05875 [Planctomycetaceae bacterium SCGC AG-212-F19]